MLHVQHESLNAAEHPRHHSGPRSARYFTGCLWACIAVLTACWVGVPEVARSDEDDSKAKQAEQAKSASKRRLALMQEAIDAFSITSPQIKSEKALRLGKSPKLRYDDPVRSLLDAGVWRMGEEGRPLALVTLELYGAGEARAVLSYEFLSLIERQFSMRSPKGPVWNPAETELKFASLENAPQADKSEKLRLTQMRQIARRFDARQDYRGDKIELRLMPQPIDRYRDQSQRIVDGAVFVFANGTNPELGLLLETDGKRWSYAVFRLASAALSLDLDGKEVAAMSLNLNHGDNPKLDEAYMATTHEVMLPE